jgi:hypothetical protein
MELKTREVVTKYLIFLIIGTFLVVATAFIVGTIVSNKEVAADCGQYGFCLAGALAHYAILILAEGAFLIIWLVLFIMNLIRARKTILSSDIVAVSESLQTTGVNLKFEGWLISFIYLSIPFSHLFVSIYIGTMSHSLDADFYIKEALFYCLFVLPFSFAAIWATSNVGLKVNQTLIRAVSGFLPLVYIFVAFGAFSYRFGYTTLRSHIDKSGWDLVLNLSLGLAIALFLSSSFLFFRILRKLRQ